MALLTVLISERGVGDGKNSEKSAIKRGKMGRVWGGGSVECQEKRKRKKMGEDNHDDFFLSLMHTIALKAEPLRTLIL